MMIIDDINGRIESDQNLLIHYQRQFEVTRQAKDRITNRNGRVMTKFFEDYDFCAKRSIQR